MAFGVHEDSFYAVVINIYNFELTLFSESKILIYYVRSVITMWLHMKHND